MLSNCLVLREISSVSEPSAKVVLNMVSSPYLSLLTSASNVSIVKKQNVLLTVTRNMYQPSFFNLNLVWSRQSASSGWNTRAVVTVVPAATSEQRNDNFFLFSQSLTSKRDITLFLNKPFFCDKRLWLWFNICFTSQQYRLSIYTGTEQYSQQLESMCVTYFCCSSYRHGDRFVPQWDHMRTDFCACKDFFHAHKWYFVETSFEPNFIWVHVQRFVEETEQRGQTNTLGTE